MRQNACLSILKYLSIHAKFADINNVEQNINIETYYLIGTTMVFFMSSLCGVGVCVRVRVNNFSSKTTRPRDVLFFFKDTLSIDDEKLFKACKSVCSSVC